MNSIGCVLCVCVYVCVCVCVCQASCNDLTALYYVQQDPTSLNPLLLALHFHLLALHFHIALLDTPTYELLVAVSTRVCRLTKLRHLALPDAPATAHMQTMTPAIAAYLPQLESLELRGCEIHDEDKWDLLFNEASTSHTLTRLDITAPLSAELVKLLVQHCPALKVRE